MTAEIKPISYEDFKPWFLTFFKLLAVSLLGPVSLYAVGHWMQNLDLIIVSMVLLFISQLVFFVWWRKKMIFEGRLKDIFPELSEKALRLSTSSMVIPFVWIIFLGILRLSPANSSSKFVLYFRYPRLAPGGLIILLAAANFGFIFSSNHYSPGLVRSSSLEPVSFFASKITLEVKYLLDLKYAHPEAASAFSAIGQHPGLEKLTGTGMLLGLTMAFSKGMANRKIAVTQGEDEKLAAMITLVEDTIKVMEKKDSGYVLTGYNPISYINPSNLMTLSLLVGVEEVADYKINRELISKVENLMEGASKTLDKADGQNVQALKIRMEQLKTSFYSLPSYKSSSMMKESFLVNLMTKS